jgi:hypothetical protein
MGTTSTGEKVAEVDGGQEEVGVPAVRREGGDRGSSI